MQQFNRIDRTLNLEGLSADPFTWAAASQLIGSVSTAYRDIKAAKKKPAPVIIQQPAPMDVKKIVIPITLGLAGIAAIILLKK